MPGYKRSQEADEGYSAIWLLAAWPALCWLWPNVSFCVA